MRSDQIKKGTEKAPHRALLKSLGLQDDDMAKPLIGVANSFTNIVPGHIHLRIIGEAVKEGILSAGGTPFEFNTIAVCDGIAMGHDGMRYSLPSREIIPEDHFIIAQTSKRLVALVVDSVSEVVEIRRDQIVDAEASFPYAEYISGVAKIDTDIVFISDLELFLSSDEQQALDEALLSGVE